MESMEFHRLGQEKIEKIFWPGRAGLAQRARPGSTPGQTVWPAQAGPGSLSLCKLNGGSTAEVKELG